MGEVYSAISKGVVDGVVAPADAVKSLHFNEVARHLSLLQVARGAYPARAMSDTCWNALSPDLRRILTEATPVWQAALAREVREAEAETEGMSILTVDPAEQARFDAAYDAEALRSARRLAQYGAPAEAIYRKARAVIAQGTPVKAC